MAIFQFPGIQTATLDVSSSAFTDQGFIPAVYSCEGKSINPPLTIKNIPAGTQSLALILHDPDAKKPGGFDHWVAWNIDPSKPIAEGSAPGTAGQNGAGKTGYTGPCPPAGTGVHHYHFRVYALDATINLTSGADRQALEKAMKGHILAKGELVGLYKNVNDK